MTLKISGTERIIIRCKIPTTVIAATTEGARCLKVTWDKEHQEAVQYFPRVLQRSDTRGFGTTLSTAEAS